MSKSYIPTGFHILIELDRVEEKSAGGIIVNVGDEAKREQGGMNRGTILAFGNTCFKMILHSQSH